VGRTLNAVEDVLSRMPDGTAVTADSIKRLVRDHRPTNDQLAVVTSALAATGALERVSNALIFREAEFRASAGLREGIRTGIAAANVKPPVRLLAALPPPFDSTHLTPAFWDLRAALIDLIASAESHLLLASPFWDEETVDELADLLQRKVDQGVTIDLIGREVGPSPPGRRPLADLIERLGSPTTVHATAWLHQWPKTAEGVQTFHFKCAVSDHGARAYLGSANFTSSGLRSRAELGVLLSPPLSIELNELVVLLVASRSR
jgi:phosphatidylserine/phosphatidylglycerophosphate/cardiolipin synthase-like enzyme